MIVSLKKTLVLSLSILVHTYGYCFANKAADTGMVVMEADNVVLDNGIVSATIAKRSAHIISYKYKGEELAKDGYYSMDGGKSYTQPKNCVVSIKTNTKNLVDVAFASIWQPSYRNQAVDIECHYVIERGNAGIYCYAILNHQPTYPKTGIGEWRYVFKLAKDAFNHIVIDSLRNMDLPTSEDFAKAERTSIPESVKITSGIRAGSYECKYSYSVEYYKLGVYGQTNTNKNIGSWIVLGGYDYLNDGPTKADLNAAAGGNLIHFGRNHYQGSGISLDAGEDWSKIFGPFLLYVNADKGGTGAMWAGAKQKVADEKAKWPYKWLTDIKEYPTAEERGSVSGVFTIKDAFKPEVEGGNAWIGLIDTSVANWEFDSKHYQYWVKTDNNGKFTIANVRPGHYTLHAFSDGEVNEYAKSDIEVTKGDRKNLGKQIWNIDRTKGKLIWEIGVPDRTAAEFSFGKEYWKSFIWKTYCPAFSNPLVYTVGKSDWHNDWNFAQSSYWHNDSSYSAWPWKINFKLDKLPSQGEATLTFAFAAADRSRLNIYVNDESKPFNTFSPIISGGNTLVRQGIHAKYSTYTLKIPVSKLKLGDNSIILISNNGRSRVEHIMYDYISMEMHQ